jgi:carbon storage regulator CsrA
MLILAREINESVVIWDPEKPENKVTVTVVRLDGRKVRLGFMAPDEIHVDRFEVWQAIQNGQGRKQSITKARNEEVQK